MKKEWIMRDKTLKSHTRYTIIEEREFKESKKPKKEDAEDDE